ncbi:MAG: membrane protein insertase YidC [Bacteroidia bacterium]|nr:membrane protein insertase YidC [Bacteroidia bacterium]
MDRNNLVGTLLIVLMTVLFFIYQSKNQPEILPEDIQETEDISGPAIDAPSKENTAKFNEASPSSTITNTENADSGSLSQVNKAKFGAFYKNLEGEEKTYTLENEKFKINISSKGGSIQTVELKEYKHVKGGPLYLVRPERQKRGFIFPQERGQAINTNDLFFETNGSSFIIEGESEKEIRFRLKVSEDSYFEQIYKLKGNSYMVDYDVRFVNMNGVIPSYTTYINHFWNQDLEPQEKDLTTSRRYSTLYYKYKGDDVENLNLNKSEEEEADNVEWVSFKQHFFNSTLFYPDGFEKSTFTVEVDNDDTSSLKAYSADINLPYRSDMDQAYSMSYYFGPNDYRLLKKIGSEFEDIIQLAPDFFLFSWMSLVSKAIIIPIFNFLERYFSSYGIIILIMTLLIKMALFPLTFKSYKSAAAMRVLKPEIDELKEKYGDDQSKLGTEQMKLYSKAGVNPLGGCLPMLLQMPILLAMYYFFPSSIELRQESFLWASDLSTYDNILNLPFTIPMYGSHVSLFTLLMFVSSILYATVQPQMSSGGPGGMQMKYMPYIFPIFLLVLFNSWPAALTYYYFLSNIITYLQSWAAKKFFIDEDKLHAKMQENKKKPRKKSKWQKRLEDIQKQQKEVQKTRSKAKQKK